MVIHVQFSMDDFFTGTSGDFKLLIVARWLEFKKFLKKDFATLCGYSLIFQ